jgi:hypothetical protein
MPFGWGMTVNHCCRWHLNCFTSPQMKYLSQLSLSWMACVAFFASIMTAAAHPGHYHPPGEDDEFNALRADWFHLHGWTEVSLALVALAAAVIFVANRRSSVRLGAALAFGGSIALIAAI